MRWGLKVGACAAPDEKGIASEGAASEADGSFDAVAYINTRAGRPRVSASSASRTSSNAWDVPRMRCASCTWRARTARDRHARTCRACLRARGVQDGAFHEPLRPEVFEERIRVDGENISRDDLVRATLAVREHACAMEAETGEHPTEFELMTAVAFEHFRAVGCDIVVLEVGAWRKDSTNVIERPEACVICRIGLDHTAVLGDTLLWLRGEKAGIIKPGVAVASWPQEPEAREVVAAVARRPRLRVDGTLISRSSSSARLTRNSPFAASRTGANPTRPRFSARISPATRRLPSRRLGCCALAGGIFPRRPCARHRADDVAGAFRGGGARPARDRRRGAITRKAPRFWPIRCGSWSKAEIRPRGAWCSSWACSPTKIIRR